MMAQMGIFANAMMGPNINVSPSQENGDSGSKPNTTSAYADFLNNGSPENGYHGDNSAQLLGLQGATVCINCEGAGFLSPSPAVAVLNQPVAYYLESSPSSASMDSAMDATDMDMDADADADMMIMCM